MTGSSALFLALFLAVAVITPLAPIGLAHLWSWVFTPIKRGPSKNATYECGIAAGGNPRIQFHSQYYVYGIIFLVFDVEAVFLIPIAVAFLELPMVGVIAAALFILLLLESLAWVWAKGYLAWK